MPMLGIGTWTLSDDVAERSVYSALSCGYRLVDTAQYYGNEAGVGRAVRRAEEDGVVARKDVFVTTKISPGSYSDPAPSIDASLDRLGLDYIDLMLIHQPGSNDAGVYRAMEDALAAGKLRSIGISNYYTPAEFDQVMSYAEVTPTVIQNENHLFCQNAELRDYVSQFGTVVESWYPFCGRGHTQDAFGNGEVEDIASARGMTPAQVVARWHVQEGYVAIPGSSNPDHIVENIESLAFKLGEDDMRRLRALDSQHRYERW